MDTEIIIPQERKDAPAAPAVEVGQTNDVDVVDDNSVINHVQRRRLAFIAEISPNGAIENKKDRHLYLQALSDTATSAQQRISANNQVDDASRDRAIVAEVLAQMSNQNLTHDLPETGTIPSPTKRFTKGDIDTGILDNNPKQETNDEFMARVSETMHVDDDEE